MTEYYHESWLGKDLGGGGRGLFYVFWYSDYGGESDVSLNCGSFYGPTVRPQMRMSEWANEWMNEWTFFFNFRKSGSHGGMILTGENRTTRRKACPNGTLSTTNLTGLTWARNQAVAVRGRRLTTWTMARPLFYVTIRLSVKTFRKITKTPKKDRVAHFKLTSYQTL
jgi:hypothetical protein